MTDHPLHPTFLVVDDEPDMLTLMGNLVGDAFPGATVRMAASAPAGLAAIAQEPVDLIVSDYQMRPMDGIEFLAKATQTLPDVRTVLVSAYADPNIDERATREAKVDVVLLKPFDPEHLIDTISRLLAPIDA